jgi:hypothetical protein
MESLVKVCHKMINTKRLSYILSFVLCITMLFGCKGKDSIRVHLTEIIDIATGQPVEADVYVNGNLVSRGVTEATFDVPVPGTIEVKHPDYHLWAIEINAKTERALRGPVRLRPLPVGGESG